MGGQPGQGSTWLSGSLSFLWHLSNKKTKTDRVDTQIHTAHVATVTECECLSVAECDQQQNRNRISKNNAPDENACLLINITLILKSPTTLTRSHGGRTEWEKNTIICPSFKSHKRTRWQCKTCPAKSFKPFPRDDSLQNWILLKIWPTGPPQMSFPLRCRWLMNNKVADKTVSLMEQHKFLKHTEITMVYVILGNFKLLLMWFFFWSQGIRNIIKGNTFNCF